jgi:hypothetical protein
MPSPRPGEAGEGGELVERVVALRAAVVQQSSSCVKRLARSSRSASLRRTSRPLRPERNGSAIAPGVLVVSSGCAPALRVR